MRIRRTLVAALSATALLGATATAAQADTIDPWSSTFQIGNWTEWDWWGAGQESIWGTISIEDPIDDGVPIRTDRSVGRFEVSATDLTNGRRHAKLYKDWSTRDRSGVEHPPSDISGAYSAWYYIPSDYDVPYGAATNIFQFKEKYYNDTTRESQSDPSWWVNLSTASWAVNDLWPTRWTGELPTDEEQPVLMLQCGNGIPNDPCWERTIGLQAAPLDRWFEIRAEVHDGDRIDLFVDGVLMDTGTDAQRSVGTSQPRSENWTFGVGNYHTGDLLSPDVLYVDGAKAELLGTSAPTATTVAAGFISYESAVLKATVNPNRLATTYWFEWGTTTSYGSRAPATAAVVGSDGSGHALARAVPNLREGTTYHYRVVAKNSAGTTNGADRTFTTRT